MVKIGNDWDELLSEEWGKPYYQELRAFLRDEYGSGTVYPPAEDIFNALKYTAYKDVKAVILGQDPYHEPGQAQGLAFSVPCSMPEPPSLVNILKELLLNTVLTVRAHKAGSHRNHGWEKFTDRVIELLASREQPMVFILWGANAGAKKDLIINAQRNTAGNGAQVPPLRHLIIRAPHPSPLSAYRGFFGGRYFSRCNYFLEDNGIAPVDWSLRGL